MLRVKPANWGEVVREERERRHLTQVEAAAEIDVSPRTLQGWEIEDVTPQPKQRRAILAWLANGKEAA